MAIVKSCPSAAQDMGHAETGIPFSTYYTPKVYNADPQNWAIVQRDDGVMIFGNGDGILAFDGAAWQSSPMSNNNLVRALAFGPQRKLFVGGYNEIGYIDYNGTDPSYTSLLPKLSDGQRLFGHTWSITVVDDAVYFATDASLLKWYNEKFVEITLPGEDSRPFVGSYREGIIVQPGTSELLALQDDSLVPVNGGEFYRGKRVVSILPYDGESVLVCTLSDGVFIYNGISSKPFAAALSGYFKENRLYKAIGMRDGKLAFGTLQRGCVVLDHDGTLVHFLEKGAGLGDNAVYNLLEDHEGALWVAMSVGLSRVELQAPVTVFDERSGLVGAVNDVVRFEGHLYAATMLGFYRLEKPATVATHATFRKLPDVHSSVWATASGHGSLLLATDDGTMELKNGRFSYLDNESGAVMLASQYDRTVVFAGLADGVVVLKFIEGRWKSLGRIQDIVADVGEMNEDTSGNLWLGTFSEGAIRLQFSGEGPDKYLRPAVSHFGPAHGLPVGYLQLNRIGDELVFRVEPHATLYQFNVREERFHRLSSRQVSGKATQDSIALRPSIPDYDSATQYPLTGEKNGKLWMISRGQRQHVFDVIRLARNGVQYQKHTLQFARIREDFDEAVYEDDSGDIWMGGLDGILRYDRRAHGALAGSFNVIVNRITITNDSTVHNGMHTVKQDLALPYDLNSITFSYGATSFDLLEETEFQYFLEGFDKDWSAWSRQQSKSYTQVPEGYYLFNVRARNIYGDVSPATTFAFSIAPPWHRHIIAYVCYALLFCGMIYGAVVARSRKLERDKEGLMRIIEERTAEISTKNTQLEQQAEELKAQTEQLKEMDKVKSAFFTNISHEFRTPLSLILAPLEKEISDGSASPESAIMYRNARRLQGLINQLLDLSRLESGEMKVFLCRNDLTAFVRGIVTSFQALAESRNIAFIVSLPTGPLDGYFDPDKLETVLYNLLSNAFKFTPEGGSVTFAMNADTGSQQCAFTVADTGGGIPPTELGRIFDRFYQVESGVRRSFEGSGIGLALTRELVVLMQGTITVDSVPGEGTSFRVCLPFSRGESTIVPEEIAMSFEPATAGPSAAKDTAGDGEEHQHMETTILLVEDNIDLNAYLTSILNKTYNVLTAYNGEDALRIALSELPDLILSDMMMPRMDGFALCEEIRKEATTSHIPFILLTARTSVESRLAGLELGADDYLTKPFVVAELLVRVRNLLHQRKQLQARFRQELTVAPRNITVTSADEAFLRKVMDVTEASMKDASFSVERLGEEVGISRKHLHRKLVAIVGQTPNEFIRIFRLKMAMQLLQQQSGSVKEVAFGVGFSNLSYFAKCFKEEFGVSPTEVKLKTQEESS